MNALKKKKRSCFKNIDEDSVIYKKEFEFGS